MSLQAGSSTSNREGDIIADCETEVSGLSGHSDVHLVFSLPNLLFAKIVCVSRLQTTIQAFLGFLGLSGVHFRFFSHSSCQKIQTWVSTGWFISNLFSACLGEHSIVCIARLEKRI